MRRGVRIPLLILRGLLGAAFLVLVLLLVAAGWLLATPDGARFAADLAQRATGGQLHIGRVRGRLIGPLRVTDVRYVSDGLTVAVDTARLDWTPSALMAGQLRIDALSAGTPVITLGPPQADPEATQADPEPRLPTSLPLDILVDALHVDALVVRDADGGPIVELGAIDFAGAWVGERVNVERLDVDGTPVGEVRAQLAAMLDPQAVDLQRLTLDGPLHLEASGRLALAGDSDIDAQWEHARWPLDGEPLVRSPRGSLQLQGTPQDARIALSAVLGEATELDADAHWSEDRVDGRLNWRDLQWPLQGDSPLLRSDAGQLEVDGSPQDWRATLDAGVRWMRDGAPVDGALQARANGDLEHAVVEQLAFAGLGGRLTARGRTSWQGAPEVDLQGTLQELDPGSLVAGLDATLNGRFSARAELGDPRRANLTLSLDDSLWRGHTLDAELQADVDGERVTLAQARVVSGDNRLTAEGRAWPDFDLTLNVDADDLSTLAPQWAGAARLDAQLGGTLQTPRLAIDGEAQGLVAGAAQVAELSIDGLLDLDGPLQLDLDARDVQAGAVYEELNVQLDGRVGDHRLDVTAVAPRYRAHAALQGALDITAQDWRGQLVELALAPERLAAWSLAAPAPLALSASRQQLQDACLTGEAGRLCIAGLHDAGTIDAELLAEQVDLAWLQPLLPPDWTLQTGVDGHARARLVDGALGAVDVDLRLAAGHVADPRERQIAFGDGQLRVVDDEAGGIDATLRLPLDDGRIAGDVALGAAAEWGERPLDGQLDIAIDDIEWVAYLSREINEADGRIDVDLTLDGTLGEPVVGGAAQVSDGHLRLTTPGIDVEEIDFTARADGRDLVLEGSARSSGGIIRAEGRLAQGLNLDLSITGDKFLAADLAIARVRVSPDLDITYDGQLLDIRGEVLIPEAAIRPTGFEGGETPSSDQIIVSNEDEPATQAGLQVRAAVDVILGENVTFSGFGLQAGLDGHLMINERTGRPTTARGEIRLTDGQYKAYGQQLDIETGRLLYSGGPIASPAVEVRATREPRDDIRVGVLVRGTLEAPEFSLFSEPSMPQQEQLSWLLLGRPLEQAGSSSDRSLVASAALSLGVSGSNKLAQNLKSGLGIDDINIGSDPGDGVDQTMLTVGKYLSPSLYVSYGIGIFEQGYQLRLIYDIGRGFKLSTESGIETGADLLYSIEVE